MCNTAWVASTGHRAVVLLLATASASLAQYSPKPVGSTVARDSRSAPVFRRAFVVDDRLSALRRRPALQAEVIRRLRLGHAVFLVGSAKPPAGKPEFCRVAVTRRTRGWVHESALVVQGRAGEDRRLLKLIDGAGDGVDRIALCRILAERFSNSPLVPRAMLLLGEEAERAAETLSQRVRRRLAGMGGADAGPRAYYLSDSSLDRYSKLTVVFDFNESTGEFVYDGKAYREIVRRFPTVEEASLARKHLELISLKMARQP